MFLSHDAQFAAGSLAFENIPVSSSGSLSLNSVTPSFKSLIYLVILMSFLLRASLSGKRSLRLLQANSIF